MGRMQKVNELMKRELGSMLQREMRDPRLQFVTITEVSVSPDLHHARIKFSVLGQSANVEDVTESLNHAAGYMRRFIAKNLRLRYTPELEFIYDPSIEYSVRIEQTLKDIDKLAAETKDECEITEDRGGQQGGE